MLLGKLKLFSSKKTGVTVEEKKKHKEAEYALNQAKQRLSSQVKILLLGSGDSGKSTVLKQMRFIHRVPFTSREIENYRHLIFNNIIEGLKKVIDAMVDMDLALSSDSIACLDLIVHAPDLRDGEPFPREYYKPLKALWADEGVQQALERGNEVALPENLTYFFPDLDRLFSRHYEPNDQDIIRCRARTTGISETVFKTKGGEILMVDVGGQKSERRKWIHCFEDVTCLLFLASLNGYDQCLVEDRAGNQMQDAMTLWDEICVSPWFKKTSIILFLNKDDLFREKLRTSDIRRFYPDYDGDPADVAAGRTYFKERFIRIYRKMAPTPATRQLYIHFTNATDTMLLRVVMAAVEDVVLSDNIRNHLL